MTDIPSDILAAAYKVAAWAETNGGRLWQLGPVCDRRWATMKDHIPSTLEAEQIARDVEEQMGQMSPPK